MKRRRWLVEFLDCDGDVMPDKSSRYWTRRGAERYAASMQVRPGVQAILDLHRPGVPLWTTKVSKL